MSDLSPGDRVRDREGDEDTDLLTVIRVLDESAGECVLFVEPGGSETTVESFHLGKYPASDRVVECVYGNDVEEARGSVTSPSKKYAFPRSRLELVELDEEGES